jgi:hypothetical protein
MKARCKYGVINESPSFETVYSLCEEVENEISNRFFNVGIWHINSLFTDAIRNSLIIGSLLAGACVMLKYQQAPSGVVAQLGERLVCTQEVASSILADSTDSWRAGGRPAISKKMRTQ